MKLKTPPGGTRSPPSTASAAWSFLSRLKSARAHARSKLLRMYVRAHLNMTVGRIIAFIKMLRVLVLACASLENCGHSSVRHHVRSHSGLSRILWFGFRCSKKPHFATTLRECRLTTEKKGL